MDATLRMSGDDEWWVKRGRKSRAAFAADHEHGQSLLGSIGSGHVSLLVQRDVLQRHNCQDLTFLGSVRCVVLSQ